MRAAFVTTATLMLFAGCATPLERADATLRCAECNCPDYVGERPIGREWRVSVRAPAKTDPTNPRHDEYEVARFEREEMLRERVAALSCTRETCGHSYLSHDRTWTPPE